MQRRFWSRFRRVLVLRYTRYDCSACRCERSSNFDVQPYPFIPAYLPCHKNNNKAPRYTVLIRGLLLRKQYRPASMFFTKLMKSGLPLDNPALAAGLEALTRNGQPHLAFQVLEKYTIGTTTPMILTTLTLNQFLVSLNRIGRPDISIRLFTHMQLCEQADLDKAISLHRDALKLFPAGHPGRPTSFDNLATSLTMRFEKLSKREDLDEATELFSESINSMPAGTLLYVIFRCILCAHLC